MSAPAVLRLASDVLEVELLPEIGGRLHRLRAFGRDLLLTPEDPERHRHEPVFWGGYVMAPWCNRAEPGPTTLLGERVDLAANFEDGSAIHGLVLDVPWWADDSGRLAVSAGGDERWPWAFEVTGAVAVEGSTLSLAYELRNRSERPMPAGLGLHPWFRRPLSIGVPAASVYRSNTNSPRRPEAVDGRLDLRDGGEPPLDLDGTWADLADPRVNLAWPALGVRARLAIDAQTPHVAVATPANRDGFAVEPQTHAPDPLRRLATGEPGAPSVLAPGGTLTLRLRLVVERS